MWNYMPCINGVRRSRRLPAIPASAVRRSVSTWPVTASPGCLPGPDPFDPFVDYFPARLTDDPHLRARTCSMSLRSSGSVCRIRA